MCGLWAFDLAAHLVIGSASRCDECPALGAGAIFECKAALSAAHPSRHERHPVDAVPAYEASARGTKTCHHEAGWSGSFQRWVWEYQEERFP
jgi:hypothetical protein